MTREQATNIAYQEFAKYPALKDWRVRLTMDVNRPYLGLCLYNDKCIIINAHHVDMHPDAEIINTIRHEIAHALVGPFHGHNETWAEKAREIGCDNVAPCSHLSFTPEVIDAIRSGADVEVTFDEQIIRTPKYKVTRLQDKCPTCGKVAVTVKQDTIKIDGDTKPDLMVIKLECGHTIFKKVPKGTPFHNFQAYGDPNCKHEWDKNSCLLCSRKRPFPFQLDGMRFAEMALSINKGVAILDEMGLGKTQQALGTIKFHPELWPVLYVVKSGIKFQWFKAILDWMGDEFIGQIINTSSDIIIPGLRSYIISYDMMVPKTKKLKSGKVVNQGFDIQKIIDSPIKTIVLDECQQIKNTDSSRTQQVRRIAKDRIVIALSGTPWKNKGGELFSMFNMIAPMKFHSNQAFLDKWVEFYWSGQFRKQGGIRRPDQFKEYIKDIAIRRERKDVMPELPSVTRTKLHVQMTPNEDETYGEAVDEFVKWYQEEQEDAKSAIHILAKIQRLRHLTGIFKVPATLDYIAEFIEDTDKKLVIFVHHKDVGESIYQQALEKFGEEIPVMKLTAELSGQERFEIQTKFNELPRAILIASTLASGEGLNLQTCADCVMHERQWNAANEEQAEGRFIRIGQESKVVNAVYAQVADSIDSFLDAIVERKRRYFHVAHNTGEVAKWNEHEIVKELADVIVRSRNAKKNREVIQQTA